MRGVPIIHSFNARANSNPRSFQLCTGCLQYCHCGLLISLSSHPQLYPLEEGCNQIYKAHLLLF